MRSSVIFIAALVAAIVILVVARKLTDADRKPAPKSEIISYLQSIKPIEAEMEDVRKHLRAMSQGKASGESAAHIASDAQTQLRELQVLQPPPNYRDVHQELLQWTRVLADSSKEAVDHPSQTLKLKIEEAVGKADSLYKKVESQVADDER